MREFTLYGLEGARLVSTERIATEDANAARAAMVERLAQYQRVELWEGPICLLRRERPQRPLSLTGDSTTDARGA